MSGDCRRQPLNRWNGMEKEKDRSWGTNTNFWLFRIIITKLWIKMTISLVDPTTFSLWETFNHQTKKQIKQKKKRSLRTETNTSDFKSEEMRNDSYPRTSWTHNRTCRKRTRPNVKFEFVTKQTQKKKDKNLTVPDSLGVPFSFFTKQTKNKNILVFKKTQI